MKFVTIKRNVVTPPESYINERWSHMWPIPSSPRGGHLSIFVALLMTALKLYKWKMVPHVPHVYATKFPHQSSSSMRTHYINSKHLKKSVLKKSSPPHHLVWIWMATLQVHCDARNPPHNDSMSSLVRKEDAPELWYDSHYMALNHHINWWWIVW